LKKNLSGQIRNGDYEEREEREEEGMRGARHTSGMIVLRISGEKQVGRWL
jgi:hypothetical protein